MSGTDLVQAPVIEIREYTDGLEDIPDMTAHIYHPGMFVSLCGIKAESDPHHHFHHSHGISPARVPPGCRDCAKCGAPICEACFAINQPKENT